MNNTSHYYGDEVRRLFLTAAVVMTVLLPWINKFLTISLGWSLVTITGLGLAAGLMNPRQKWTGYLNVAVSATAFVIFEWHGVQAYLDYGPASRFFATNQLLAIIFVFAMYFAAKTARGFFLRQGSPEN